MHGFSKARRGGALATGCLVLALSVSACNGGNTSGNDTSGTDDNLNALPRYDSVPAVAVPSMPGRVQVSRGHGLGAHNAQVLVRLAWYSGEKPRGTQVHVHLGDKVEVQVWSDRKATVKVPGQSVSAPVAPGSPVAVDFTASAPRTKVEVAGTPMVAFVTG